MTQERESVQRKWKSALVEKKILEEAVAKINTNVRILELLSFSN